MAAFFATALLSIMALGQTTIAQWSFEGVTTANTGTTPSISGGSTLADAGSQTGGSAFLDITQILQLFRQIH